MDAMTETIEIPSPVGPLIVEAGGGRIRAVSYGRGSGGGSAPGPELEAARLQLAEYFSGGRREFELPLDPPGQGFDGRVLAAVGQIPYGERRAYGEVTQGLGLSRDQVRKVAAAIGRNPLPILIPCHRVVGADGSLTGYGGGLARKAQLLALEAGQPQLAAPA
jgi:methylated-DNA-[protein]-cysteine S-methyltransferase